MYIPHAYTPLYLLGYLTTCLCTHPTYIVPTVSVVDTQHGLYGPLLVLPSRPLFSWAAGQRLRVATRTMFFCGSKETVSPTPIYTSTFFFLPALDCAGPFNILAGYWLSLMLWLITIRSILVSYEWLPPPLLLSHIGAQSRRNKGLPFACYSYNRDVIAQATWCVAKQRKGTDYRNRYHRDHSGIMRITYYIGAGE